MIEDSYADVLGVKEEKDNKRLDKTSWNAAWYMVIADRLSD